MLPVLTCTSIKFVVSTERFSSKQIKAILSSNGQYLIYPNVNVKAKASDNEYQAVVKNLSSSAENIVCEYSSSYVYPIQYSVLDDERIIIKDSEKGFSIKSMASGKIIDLFTLRVGHMNLRSKYAINVDNTLIAIISTWTTYTYLFEIERGILVKSLANPNSFPVVPRSKAYDFINYAFDPLGQYLVLTDPNNRVTVFDLTQGQPVSSFIMSVQGLSDNKINNVFFHHSSDGSLAPIILLSFSNYIIAATLEGICLFETSIPKKTIQKWMRFFISSRWIVLLSYCDLVRTSSILLLDTTSGGVKTVEIHLAQNDETQLVKTQYQFSVWDVFNIEDISIGDDLKTVHIIFKTDFNAESRFFHAQGAFLAEEV